MKYELQVWDKTKRKYITTWEGHDFVRAQIMAAKPYNNYDWMGKKRIIGIEVVLELQHVGRNKKRSGRTLPQSKETNAKHRGTEKENRGTV